MNWRGQFSVKSFCDSKSGNIAIVAALSLTGLIGAAGLGTETGYWFYKQRLLQGAADVVAYNATVALRGGSTNAQIITAASTDATTNGWTSATGTIHVNTPPTSGTHQNANSVEVLLTETEQRYLTAIFSDTPISISVRAVGNFSSTGTACVLALSKTASQAVKIWGNNATTFVGCNVMSNSMANDSVAVGGSSQLTTPCVLAVGGISVSSTLNLTSCKAATAHSFPATDPYASLPAPDTSGPCKNVSNGNSPMNPGVYCNGLSLNSTKTFNPGVYVISGGSLTLNSNANVSGSGVTFYLTNGATIKFNGNAHMNFSAPTSGTYSGMLFYGNRNDPDGSPSFNGDATSQLTGATYFPSQSVTMNGNFSGANGCMQVIANTISLSGSSTISGSCPGTGMSSVSIPGSVSLVE
ncbi:MAG TPA: hypothetical protein VNH44_16345 [Micropepsaceae bacterium]|nr:hypothetical protein [Micropepsaceae bacterium]